MSALRFEANADSKPQVHRLAHHRLNITAHTWRTFVAVDIDADGRVIVVVQRDGRELGKVVIDQREEPLA